MGGGESNDSNMLCKSYDIHKYNELPFKSAKRAGGVCVRPDVSMLTIFHVSVPEENSLR